MEKQQQAYDLCLSEILGIDYHTLINLDYRILDIEDETGGIYGYRMVFRGELSEDILEQLIVPIHDNQITIRFSDIALAAGYDDLSEYYDEHQLDAIRDDKNAFKSFGDEMMNIEELSGINIEDRLTDSLYRQLFIATIGNMETYFSDTFINRVLDSEFHFRKFVRTHPEFANRKLDFKDIFSEVDKIRETVKVSLLSVIYHNIVIVKQMYTQVFGIDFPDIRNVRGYVEIRHDLVHRNGKDKNGQISKIDDELLHKVITDVRAMVFEVERRLLLKKIDDVLTNEHSDHF